MGAHIGISDYSGYAPRQAMSRAAMVEAIGWTKPVLKGFAKGSRRYAEWDEDPITLSVAAARPLAGNPPAQLCFASTSAPFLDRQNAGVIAAALDLPNSTHCFELSGSQRAATSALISLSKTNDSSILVAAERRQTKAGSVAEMLAGDGAAALHLRSENILAEIIGTQAIYADIVDHYRTQNTGTDYQLEDRWFRDQGLVKIVPQAVSPLLKDAGISASDIDHFILSVPNSSMAKTVAKALSIKADAIADGLFDKCGFTGAAHSLMMLVEVLDKAKAGAWILLCGFGQGCDAILLRTTDALAKRQKVRPSLQSQLGSGKIEDNYAKFLSAAGKLEIDWGMRAERDNRTAQSVAYNKSRDIYGFVGGKCDACGTPQFPKARRCVSPQCGALDTQSDYRFAELNASVKSFTEDWLAFTRNPPLLYGNIDFEGGGNVFLEMTSFGPGEVSIGTKVQPAFRIKDIDTQRGFQRYFWKAGPVSGGAHV